MTEQPAAGSESGKLQKPVLKKKRGIPFIWILPLLAALIGGGLVIKSLIEAGVPIEIVFNTADGIEAGKTKLMYRGLEVARVKAVQLNPNLQSVTVHIDIPRGAEKHLGSDAQFWLVKPEISLAGVTGLGTLLSGNYIAVKPGVEKRHASSGHCPAHRHITLKPRGCISPSQPKNSARSDRTRPSTTGKFSSGVFRNIPLPKTVTVSKSTSLSTRSMSTW